MLQTSSPASTCRSFTWTLSYEMVFYLLLAALFIWGRPPAQRLVRDGLRGGRGALGGPCSRWRRSVAGRTARSMTRLVLDAVTDALVLAAWGWRCCHGPGPQEAGASLAGLVALVLVTVNQTYPYPWSGA